MSFIGNTPAESYSTVVKDTFSGNDSDTDFTLSIPATTNSVEVLVENVQQEPTTAYTISGTTLTFTAAPVTGTNNIYVIHRGPAVQQVTPPAGVAIDASTITASSTLAVTGVTTLTDDLNVDSGTLFVDASADAVGIGTTSPSAPLTITAATADADGALGSQSPQFVINGGNANNPLEIGMDNSGATAVGFIQSRNTISGAQYLSLNPNGGNVGIGTSSPSRTLHVNSGIVNTALKLESSDADVSIEFTDSVGNSYVTGGGNYLSFTSGGAERMRIDSSGIALVGKTANGFSDSGLEFWSAGLLNVSRSANYTAYLNRLTNDGSIVNLAQDTNTEGTISVSGTTVSYNGGHLSRWSQLIDSSKDESIVKGTVMTNLDAMCEWRQVEFEYQFLISEAIEAQDEILDEDGNVTQEAVEAQDAVYETRTTKEYYDGDANTGDVIDWEYQGETVQATVIVEDNEQLNRMKVSDVEGDANVAGVFVNWDEDDDMNVAMTGDMVIRIAQGTTVQRGDLLMSAGDGTAKPQGDDIVRSKTIAKVTSTHVSHTYDDGSYLVPCVLMAC